MATLVVQIKGVQDSMSDKDIKEVLEELKSLGYKVSTIMCGECDKDDLLVELHTCHSEIENILFEPDGLHPTTDLI
jgi:hypothetical protein